MLDQNDYVVVNIWTSAKNKALPGANVGHISLQTRLGYISLWPNGGVTKPRYAPALFSPIESKLRRYFAARPADFKQDYQLDCIFEAISEEAYREVRQGDTCQADEILCLCNEGTGKVQVVDAIPGYTYDDECVLAVKPLQANVRIILFGLNEDKLRAEFITLKNSIQGWSLAGSNVLTRLTEKSKENCSSLAYRCLRAGGMYTKLKSKLSSQTSSVVTPDDLIRHVVAIKEKELQKYTETATWQVPQVTETPLDEIKRAYQLVGQTANAEERMSSFKKTA